MRCVLFCLLLSLSSLEPGSLLGQTTDSAPQPATRPERQKTMAPGLAPPPAAVIERVRKTEFQTVEITDEKATLTLAELCHGQITWRKALKDFHVDFIYSLDRRIETPEDQRSKKAGRLVPADLSYAVSLAVKNEKLYETYQELTPSRVGKTVQKVGAKTPRMQGQRKPLVFKWASDGKETRSREDYRATGTIRPGRDEAIIQHGVWYFTAVYLPYGSRGEQFKTTVQYPPNALARPDEYVVLPKLDRVDGELCHVVASDQDLMWIDAKHGFCIRRRAWLGRESPTGPWSVVFIQMAKDFAEPFKGIWLPKVWYCLQYCDASASPSLRGKLYSVDKLVVSSLRGCSKSLISYK